MEKVDCKTERKCPVGTSKSMFVVDRQSGRIISAFLAIIIMLISYIWIDYKAQKDMEYDVLTEAVTYLKGMAILNTVQIDELCRVIDDEFAEVAIYDRIQIKLNMIYKRGETRGGQSGSSN